jgi:alkyl hydroperoxide reductase subunit AhpC
MPAYNADLDKFAGYDAQVVGISCDSIPSHIAWQKRDIGLLNYPLASDFYPHGDVAQKYGVLREGDPIPGISQRAVFVVDKKGKIAMAKQYELGQQPDNEDAFEVLRKLN